MALTGFPDTGLCRNSIYRQKPFKSIIISLRIFFAIVREKRVNMKHEKDLHWQSELKNCRTNYFLGIAGPPFCRGARGSLPPCPPLSTALKDATGSPSSGGELLGKKDAKFLLSSTHFHFIAKGQQEPTKRSHAEFLKSHVHV